MEYPSKCEFLLSEDIREETNKKLTILGVYAGDDIILFSEAPGKALPSLCLLAIFRDGEGKFKHSCKVIDPMGMVIFDDKFPDPAIKEKGSNLVTAHKWFNFPITHFGIYKATVFLDEREYEYTFNVHSKTNQ